MLFFFSFEDISKKFPASNPVVRKAQLQIAMLQYNSGKVAEATATYKKGAVTYPNTEEAATALSALESIMVDTNKVDEFNQLAQQLGQSSTTKEDSLQYKAAEKIYFKNNTIELYNGENAYYFIHNPMERYPLLPPNFITVHKAQGLSLDKVLVILDDMFEITMLYTAITRAITDVKFVALNKIPTKKMNLYNKSFNTLKSILY